MEEKIAKILELTKNVTQYGFNIEDNWIELSSEEDNNVAYVFYDKTKALPQGKYGVMDGEIIYDAKDREINFSDFIYTTYDREWTYNEYCPSNKTAAELREIAKDLDTLNNILPLKILIEGLLGD